MCLQFTLFIDWKNSSCWIPVYIVITYGETWHQGGFHRVFKSYTKAYQWRIPLFMIWTEAIAYISDNIWLLLEPSFDGDVRM